jgi:hypothetical protein
MEISRVELADGQVVTVEHPEDWPEYKVTSFARLNAPQAKRTESPTGPDNKDDDLTTGDLVKLGLSRFAVQLIPDTFLISNEEMVESFRQAALGNVENAGVTQERAARQMAGVPEDAELGLGEEIVAGLADPLTTVGVPFKAGAMAIMKGLVPAVTSTVGGTAGGMGASQVAGELGAGPLVQELAGAVGGGAFATASGVATAATISTAAKVAGDVKTKVVGGDTGTLGAASDSMANSKVRAEINRIKQTSSPAEVARAVENLASLKEDVPDLEIGGLVATLVENPIVRDWVRKTTQNNKGFQKELTETLGRDAARVADSFEKILGDTEEIDRAVIANVSENQIKKTEARLRSSLDRKMENIDNVLAGLATKTLGSKDSVDVGRVSSKLLARKETEVRQAASKLYDLAKTEGKKVVLPDETVATLASLFKGVKTSDIFGPESSTAKKLEVVLKPKKKAGEEGSQVQMPKITGQDLVSLKKSLNREVSKLFRVYDRSSDQNQLLSRLFNLKDAVDKVLIQQAEDSPRFVQSIRDADAFYYRELGLPLSAEGMREIKSRKFLSGAAQSLMNYEQARDYVNFVGKPGMAVVRHAVRLKAEQAGVVDASGVMNPNKLDTFLRRNQRLIEFAGLTEEFNASTSRLRSIKNTQARHNEAYKEKSRALTNSFFRAIIDKNLSTVVKEMLNKPKRRRAYLEDIKQLDSAQRDMVLNGLRQEFLGQAMQSKGSMKDFINKHGEAVSDLFDSRYVSNVNKLADLKDLMGQMSNLLKDSLGETGVIDTLQDLTGVSIGEYAGTIRNQILSTERKFINLAMKSVTTSGKNKFYAKSAEVLLDPDVVEKLANPPQGSIKAWIKSTMEGGGDYIKDVGTYFTDVLQGHLTLATLKSMESAKDVPTPEEQEQLNQQGAQQ